MGDFRITEYGDNLIKDNSTTPLYKSVHSTITSMQDYPVDKGFIAYNFPNPFVDETTIYFSFPSNKPVKAKITIYNSIGKKIEEMIVPRHFAKEQSIKFHAKGLPAGIYESGLKRSIFVKIKAK